MFERPRSGEKAVLVHVDIGVAPDPDEFREFQELVVSAGARPVAMLTGSRKTADPRLYVGRGKAEEIRSAVVDGMLPFIISSSRRHLADCTTVVSAHKASIAA